MQLWGRKLALSAISVNHMLQVYSIKRLRWASIAAAGAMLAGCSVYAPLQPAAPLIGQKGQTEVAASAYINGRLEGSATYSPVNNVLVRVAGGLKTGGGDSTYFRLKQLEVGVGTYRDLGNGWIVGGLAGYGAGNSSRRFKDGGFESRSDTVKFRSYAAQFQKVHAELYVVRDENWRIAGRVGYGASVRLAQVRFISLTDQGLAVPLRQMTRVEPMAFLSFSDPSRFPWLHLRLTSSLSVSPDERKSPSLDERIRNTKEGRLFTSLGLVLYPHLFKE